MLFSPQIVAGPRRRQPFAAVADAMPTMTSSTSPSGVCTGSSEFSSSYSPWNCAADNAVDSTNEMQWITSATTTGWWQYQFPSATGIGGYTLRAGTTGQEPRMPKNWTLLGSQTGAFSGEEVTLDTQTGVAAFTSGLRRTYQFINFTPFIYYRLNVTLNQGDATYLQIGEIELLR